MAAFASVCRPRRTYNGFEWTVEDGDDAAPGGADPLPPLGGPAVVIWYQKTCGACRNSERVFSALERDGPAMGRAVVRVEATPARLERFRNHITSLPLYDLVRPDANAAGAYGSGPGSWTGVRLETSVRNNDLGALRGLLPALRVDG